MNKQEYLKFMGVQEGLDKQAAMKDLFRVFTHKRKPLNFVNPKPGGGVNVTNNRFRVDSKEAASAAKARRQAQAAANTPKPQAAPAPNTQAPNKGGMSNKQKASLAIAGAGGATAATAVNATGNQGSEQQQAQQQQAPANTQTPPAAKPVQGSNFWTNLLNMLYELFGSKTRFGITEQE